VINGSLFTAKTGVAWRDLSERYGLWKTVYNRFWRWSRNGTLTLLVTWARVIAEAVDELGREVDDLDREVSIDSASCAPTSTPPAGVACRSRRRPRGRDGSCRGHDGPGDHAIGRSRGGPTTKVHLACDGHRRPLPVLLTGGNVNDTTMFERRSARSVARPDDRDRQCDAGARTGEEQGRTTPL
jgi:hypothetical protein